MNTRELLALSPIVPVMVVTDLDDIVPAAQALFDGGIRAFEITLRTPMALEAIRVLNQALPAEAVVGAGTITNPAQLQDAIAAGARFGVSPGLTADLAQVIQATDLPFLPGIASASELMQALDWGFDTLKLFPAEAIGGVNLLKALAGPFAQARFCPTGGIHAGNAPDYLSLNNVLAVGGSWVLPQDKMLQHDWQGIRELAQAACALKA
ncbi:bifunctional 4-hydroxy-2-oxoglutarate aldolase/2-dehydro-3-deoxy-phosphogluconate aldolase [Vitreoscilla massiliensis]|uniref:2-dehydro-3-deoxy-phosphogluconate aldolase n=1 Tax=Vitreoscilla massiliensis TaxID=1689272 RepID=A0ABY4E2B9_9NEIS|nr:bifunctional 4-hydroxy-2-oxoglutarate aldolase/2-dehydro-3-deoxy-phosphogluconate aldolase [Vitreoscilla massiliensis]UOO89389.1 bifunctional 4-hydroxy-2-oxoglutarate aldolase/2-dehydro-3-deoxy-phosphogluconate aldolase [Vitreoscilla massiliensis]